MLDRLHLSPINAHIMTYRYEWSTFINSYSMKSVPSSKSNAMVHVRVQNAHPSGKCIWRRILMGTNIDTQLRSKANLTKSRRLPQILHLFAPRHFARIDRCGVSVWCIASCHSRTDSDNGLKRQVMWLRETKVDSLYTTNSTPVNTYVDN